MYFLEWNCLNIPIKTHWSFFPKGPINNIPALVLIMAWRRSGDKPLSEPMMVRLPTHICVVRPQWVNDIWKYAGNRLKRSTLFNLAIYVICRRHGYQDLWVAEEKLYVRDRRVRKEYNQRKKEIYGNNQLNEYFTLYFNIVYFILICS